MSRCVKCKLHYHILAMSDNITDVQITTSVTVKITVIRVLTAPWVCVLAFITDTHHH